jgi:hypothetical protein
MSGPVQVIRSTSGKTEVVCPPGLMADMFRMMLDEVEGLKDELTRTKAENEAMSQSIISDWEDKLKHAQERIDLLANTILTEIANSDADIQGLCAGPGV